MADNKPGPKKRHKGQWKPGQSGNPLGRPKKQKNQLSDGLLDAAEGYMYYYDGGKRVKIKKADFIADLIMSALTTGQFIFYPTEGPGEIRRVDVDSSEIIRLVNFYFQRLEGTPQKKEDDTNDEVKGADVSEEELEEIRTKRWLGATDQIQEALDFDEPAKSE